MNSLLSRDINRLKFRYQNLASESAVGPDVEPFLEPKPTEHSAALLPQSRRHTFLGYICSAALSLALVVVTVLYIDLLHRTASPPSLTCGNTVADAEAAGCTFDILTKAWLPAECDRHGTSNYLKIAAWNNDSWPYWADKDGTREVDVAEMARMAESGGGEWWVTEREYLAYCAWINIRMAHGVSTGSRFDRITRDYEHSRHCTALLLQWAWQAPGLDDIKARGRSVFGSC